MNCKNCGKLLKPGDSFCGGCGTPVPKVSQYGQASRPHERAPVQPAPQPVAQPVKKKKSAFPFVVLALVVLCGIVGAVSSSLEPQEVSEVPEALASAVIYPSPLTLDDLQTQNPALISQAPVTTPEAAAVTEDPTDRTREWLCAGVWVMYSPQTADAEEYVFYEDGTVEYYYRSVMDGTGSTTFEGSGTYWMAGQEIVVSVGDSTFTCWFESDNDRLWYETYNGANMTPILCYLQNYGSSPGLSTLQNDGNRFRTYIQNQ